MLKLYKQLEVVMVKSNTDNKQSETISEISLRLKQKSAKNRKIRVRLTHRFRRPTHFTAHFMFFLLILVSLVSSLAYLSSRGENTDLIATTKSLISDQKTYEKDFTSAGFDIENPNIDYVKMPKMYGIDEPDQEALPKFEEELAKVLDRAVGSDRIKATDLSRVSWRGVAQKVLGGCKNDEFKTN